MENEGHRGLGTLDQALASDSEIEAQRLLFQNTEGDTMESVRRLGLPVEAFDVQPRSQFPDIDLEMLGREGPAGYERAYNTLLNWHGYLSRQCARAGNLVLACSNALKSVSILIKRQAMARYRSKVIKSLDDVEVIVDSHPQRLEALLAYQKAKELESTLSSYFEQADPQLKTATRRIAIRDQ